MNSIRLTLRSLARSPGFTATALATLALCLGANLARHAGVIATSAGVMLVVVLLVTLVPSRHAARVNPIEALRSE